MWRVERDGGETKTGGRCAGREERRPNKEGVRSGGARGATAKQRRRPMGRDERGGGDRKRRGR